MATYKKKQTTKGWIAVFCLFALFAGILVGFFGWILFSRWENPIQSDTIQSGDLEIHFLELGNKYTGDCTYIKAGDVDILIDAGSRTSSISTITNYIDQYVTDGILEYVLITHAHEDHYAGFATNAQTDSIFDLYECQTIIDFSMTNQSDSGIMYSNYKRELADEIEAGATHYTAQECMESGNSRFDLGNNIFLQILDSYYYDHTSSSENNYSVCFQLEQGDRRFLFTGDLEAEGEAYLIKLNDLSSVDVYKAGHHGSKTSSTEAFLQVITPKIVCVCCCAGSSEYTQTQANQFPTQAFLDRIAPYTDQVYITSLCLNYSENQFTSFNGNIQIHSGTDGLSVSCSSSNFPLCDSQWLSENREIPKSWKKSEEQSSS
jgi:competence protein ComEC